MSDSIRPVQLTCPQCKRVAEIQAPRVVSVTYTCEGCGALIEQSLVTGSINVKKTKADPPS